MTVKSEFLLCRADVQRCLKARSGQTTVSAYLSSLGNMRYTPSTQPVSYCKPSVLYRVRVKLNRKGRKALWKENP